MKKFDVRTATTDQRKARVKTLVEKGMSDAAIAKALNLDVKAVKGIRDTGRWL